MKNIKKTIITLFFTIALLALSSQSVEAKGKVKISPTKKAISVGQTTTIKLKNNSKKVKWSTSNKKIKIVSKNKKQAKIKGISKGTSYLKAKVGKKTYKCKLAVKQGNGSKKNPYSAYDAHTTDIYGARYYGKAKVKLIDYKDGEKAFNYLKKNGVNKKIRDTQEYVYLKFKINYFYGEEEILADLVINPYTCFYTSNSNNQLEWVNIKCNDGTKDANKAEMSPGDTITCKVVLLIESEEKPVTYKISGYDKKWKPKDTWFTTKK